MFTNQVLVEFCPFIKRTHITIPYNCHCGTTISGYFVFINPNKCVVNSMCRCVLSACMVVVAAAVIVVFPSNGQDFAKHK